MEKQRWEESEKRREEERRSEKRKSQKKEDAGAGKGSKVAIHCAFPMICGSGGSKSRLAKAAGAEPCCQMREEKLHAVVARSTFPSQNAQETHKDQTTFGSWHAVVARSTFPSQNAQSTPFSDHFWKLRYRKSACRCAKRISKSNVQKTPHARTSFEGWDVVLCGRGKGFRTLPKVSKTWGFCSISKNDGRRGTFEEGLERCISRGRGSTRDKMIQRQGPSSEFTFVIYVAPVGRWPEDLDGNLEGIPNLMLEIGLKC